MLRCYSEILSLGLEAGVQFVHDRLSLYPHSRSRPHHKMGVGAVPVTTAEGLVYPRGPRQDFDRRPRVRSAE